MKQETIRRLSAELADTVKTYIAGEVLKLGWKLDTTDKIASDHDARISDLEAKIAALEAKVGEVETKALLLRRVA
jgi:hypothetical protein